MKFGIHLDLSVPQPSDAESERRVFDHALEQAIEAERQGFDSCWASERHLREGHACAAAPEVLLSAISARTSRMRLGTSALAHQVNHPAMIAARAASLDIVSRGRLDLAIARPITWTELSSFGGNPDIDLWDETVRALAQVWTKEPASFHGAHFKIHEDSPVPRPYQTPHPPLWADACDAQAEHEAAVLGVGLIARALPDCQEQAQRIAAYKNLAATSEAVGGFVNDQVAIIDLLYCHDGDAKSIETGTVLLRSARDLAAEPVSAHEAGLRGAPAQPSGLAVGDPRTIIETLRKWESMGVDQAIFTLNAGNAISQAEALSSLRLFASEVMPAFERQRTRAAAE